MEAQPPPDKVQCPECGGEPIEVSHNLKELGYTHDDIDFQCLDCRKTWRHGVPIGSPSPEYYEDLICRVCGEWGRVKQFKVNGDTAVLHIKCPECLYPWSAKRGKKNHLFTVGYPDVTGELNNE